MAVPTNSGEWDMPTEDFDSDFSSLLVSPRWSPLCLTPLPPQHFLPSSSSMVIYQGLNQYSMDNPLQNQQQHDDNIVDQASNMGFEESEEMRMSCFSFPPSPTYFPLCPPMPNVFFVSNPRDISLALSYQHILEDNSGSLHVIKSGEERKDIWQLLVNDFPSYRNKNLNDMDVTAREAGVVPKDMETLVDNMFHEENNDENEVTLRRINGLEQHDEGIVDQPVYDYVCVVQQPILNRGGELDVILGGGVFTINGMELRDSRTLPMSPETLLICQVKVSFRVWLEHGGQWVAEYRSRFNRLNIGSFPTVVDAISAYELVWRWSGWVYPTDYPRLFRNENKSKLPLQSPPLAREERPGEYVGLAICNAAGNDEFEAVGTGSGGTRDFVMVDQASVISRCLGKRKTKEKSPRGGERTNKKSNGVRIGIPLEDILQTKGMGHKEAAKHLGVSITKLKSSCRKHGIHRWPPRNERELIRHSLLNETPAIVDQEGIPQLTSHSNQLLMATVDQNSIVEKKIPLPQLLPTQQENPNAGFCDDDAEVIGMGAEGKGEGVMVEAQLNSGCSRKGKWKEKSAGGERGNEGTTGVQIAIAKEDILQIKGMHLKDAAKHLEVMHYETSTVIDQEGFSQLNSDTLPSNQSLSATVDTNSGIVMKIHLPQFLPEARQENPDEDFGNFEVEAVGRGTEGTGKGNEDFGSYEVEVVGMGVEGTGEGGTEEGHLNSGCSAKGKGKVETLGGNRGNKKTNKIKITLEDILQAEGMNLEDAAKKFKVSRSTLKRACRKYRIISWPPSKKNEIISHSCPKESPAVVDQEGVQQMNCDILPFEQALAAIVDTNSVVLKVRWLDSIILKIRLPKPWKMVELEQQVEKRLKLKPGTYYIRYKDEENELITILCDDDLREHISSSRLRNTISTEIFLVPK